MGRHSKRNPKLARVLLTGAAVAAPLGLSMGTAHATEPVSKWDQVAECESGGDWHINTGNGYYGGLQFSDQTWDAYRAASYPGTADKATKSQQIAVGERVLNDQGWGAWPNCA